MKYVKASTEANGFCSVEQEIFEITRRESNRIINPCLAEQKMQWNQQGKTGVDDLQNLSITGAAGRSDPRRLITSTAIWGKNIEII